MNVRRIESIGGSMVEQLSVTVYRDEKGYGMSVSGNDPVIVQSVLKDGAAWRAGVRYGDRLLCVNGMPVEKSLHDEVVTLIKSSSSANLVIQRSFSTSKVTAPLPVDKEGQRRVEYTRVQTLQRMLDEECRHRDELIAVNRKHPDLHSTELRITKLKQQIEKLSVNSFVITSKEPFVAVNSDPPVTPPRPSFPSNLPRSLSSMTGHSHGSTTGHSLRGRHSYGNNEQLPITCLDGTPPPLPPRAPNALSPEPLSPRGHSPLNFSHGQNQVSITPRYVEPNSIDVQMNFPLSATHPPIQSGGMGHPINRTSSEHLGNLNYSDGKEWENVTTPPGTPPPPYPATSIPKMPQKVIMSMEEDDNSSHIICGAYSPDGFKNIDTLSPTRTAIFLNWLIGEKRPPQAALLYLLTGAYASGPATSLHRWAYEIHSAFLIPGAPLPLSNIDENMAKDIEDVLIHEHDKEFAMRRIFHKVREKAKHELNQQLSEFQLKRQSGLGTFYGPPDNALDNCDSNKSEELAMIKYWLMPRFEMWIEESLGDGWGATYGSSKATLLAATIHPLLQYTFGLKSQAINDLLKTPSNGAPPRPTFLQRDKLYKNRIKHINKASAHPLHGHTFTLVTVYSICHCNHCYFPIWGIAPQAYNCSVCRFQVHRSCAKQIEEPCCNPVAPATRISRIMDKLSSAAVIAPNISNSHQHIDPNQHVHHHHDKKQRKSIATSNFLNIERNTRRTEEDGHTGTDSSHHYLGDVELVISQENVDELKHEEEAEATPVMLTDSECEADKRKKNKPKHRKTMSMSNTIEMVRNMGDELFEAAKREIGEHSKKKESTKKKRESLEGSKDKSDVVLVLSDATIGETDEFEVAVEHPPVKPKKKEAKVKEVAPKLASSQMVVAQKMSVRMISKASSVSGLNFMRKKRPTPVAGAGHATPDEIVLATAIFLDSERTYSDMIEPMRVKVDDKSSDEGDIFYDAKDASHDESPTDEDVLVKTKPSKVRTGLRVRKAYGGSLKRTNGKRKVRRRSAADEAPPVPPKGFVPPSRPKQSHHWLFGPSFKGLEGRTGADDDPVISTPPALDNHLERDNLHSQRLRPVTRAESYRDRAAKIHRAKRKTSDPNQLTSGDNFHDAEAGANVAATSGSSSNSSISCKSNDNDGLAENQEPQSEISDEDDGSEPWSSKAPGDLVSTLSAKARKRQDLIHELITTESSHVRSLRVLRRVFVCPLKNTTLLSSEDFKSLFPNLPDVLQRHRKLSIDLKMLSASAPIVKIKPLAEVLISTWGDPKYALTLAKFCGGQRLALDSLRERRRRTKELHSFLVQREQNPLCMRLRLQDFLACVWQRLTKYKLLLESIIQTVITEYDDDPQNSEEGLSRISHALDLAKEVLNTVDTTIKTTENEHRLKTIQAKLEIRGVGGSTESDPGELRRLDLVKHSLIMEGTLSLRQDSTKRLTIVALMLSECLVLLQKESDKYILKPIPQAMSPSSSSSHQPLSPVIHWKSVLFRPNAASKNGFFLVNIAGTQMYELKATSPAEYNLWVRNITNVLKNDEVKSVAMEEIPPPPPSNPPPPLPINQDDHPQDTSDQIIDEEHNESYHKEPEEEEPPLSPTVEEDKQPIANEGSIFSGNIVENVDTDTRPSDLVMPDSVEVIAPPAPMTAQLLLTPEERLRQAEEKVSAALREAADAAKDIAQIKPAVQSGLKSLLGKDADASEQSPAIDQEYMPTAQLLLTALEHVNSLTESLVKALRSPAVECTAHPCFSHSKYGLCDNCNVKYSKHAEAANANVKLADNAEEKNDLAAAVAEVVDPATAESKADSIVVLEEVGESSTDAAENTDVNSVLASSAGLREILSSLIQKLPAEEQEKELMRARLQQTGHRLHRLHHIHKDCVYNQDEAPTDIVHKVPNSNDQSGEG